jgi:hypothetical protein
MDFTRGFMGQNREAVLPLSGAPAARLTRGTEVKRTVLYIYQIPALMP